MRLGLPTDCFPQWPLSQVVTWAADHGYEDLEVAVWPRSADAFESSRSERRGHRPRPIPDTGRRFPGGVPVVPAPVARAQRRTAADRRLAMSSRRRVPRRGGVRARQGHDCSVVHTSLSLAGHRIRADPRRRAGHNDTGGGCRGPSCHGPRLCRPTTRCAGAGALVAASRGSSPCPGSSLSGALTGVDPPREHTRKGVADLGDDLGGRTLCGESVEVAGPQGHEVVSALPGSRFP